MRWLYNDGGRWDAGYRPRHAGDCVCRAIAIATERPYREVYEELFAEIGWSPGGRGRKDADGLVHRRAHNEDALLRRYLAQRGWGWTPTRRMDTGCTTVRLQSYELPLGRLIVSVSRHLVAVIDGVINDTGDCSRYGTRRVYGYFAKHIIGQGFRLIAP
jgi:hypothetical protein